MRYEESVETLQHALKFGIDPSLEPIRAMCAAMGNPQDKYACVQVAGTNGKSSTTRMTAALLHSQGFKTALYTSPDLTKYPERMEIDGAVVSDQMFADAIEAAVAAGEQAGVTPTEFELLTAGALWLFAREGVDWAVLECGLGGRWDATSVCTPRVAVITGIALEHTQVLGDTIEKIAAEKAAIIKEGGTAVLAANLAGHDVFTARAGEVGAPVVEVDLKIAELAGPALDHFPSYQRFNAATAITVAREALGRELAAKQVQAALENLQIPGRFETLRSDPLLLIDAAHNPQSAQVLAEEISRRYAVAGSASTSEKPPIPTLLLGVLADKDAEGIVQALAPLFSDIVVTQSASPRSLAAPELAKIVQKTTGAQPKVVDTIADALDVLASTPTIATGSITVAGEVKRVWC